MAGPALSGRRIGTFPGRKGNALSSQEKCDLEEDIWTMHGRLGTNHSTFAGLETDVWKECLVLNQWPSPCIKPRVVLHLSMVWNNKAVCLDSRYFVGSYHICFPPVLSGSQRDMCGPSCPPES